MKVRGNVKRAGVQQDANTVLEPELLAQAAEMSARERVGRAVMFQRWADQLIKSAMLMEPNSVPVLPEPKVPRGFFLVNLAGYRRKELHALARRCGVTVPMILQWAINATEIELCERAALVEMTGICRYDCYKFLGGNPRN